MATIALRPPPDDVGRQKGCKVRIARHSGVIRMASASRLSVPMVLVRMRVADPEFAKSPGAPFKSEAMDRDSRSVHQHRQGSGSDRGHRVDQEAAAIGGDGILEQYESRSDDSRLEEDVGNACHGLVMRGVDCYRHKLFVHGD